MHTRFTCLSLAPLWLAATLPALLLADDNDWTRFRGQNGSGVAAPADLPETWSESSNLRWKVDLPGPGSSSPIILDGRAYLTCYSGYGMSREEAGNPADLIRHVLCVDVNSGEKLWSAELASQHAEDAWQGFILEHGYASSTPATDGKRLFVQCGKSGLVALDLSDGSQLWHQDLGQESDPAKWGDGSSPIVWGDLVIVNAGITGHRMAAFHTETGEKVWQVDDETFTNSWATPIIVEINGREELVSACPGRIFALDPATGNELWRADSPLKETVCGSLVHHDGVVFLMGGRAGDAIAVQCGGNGDVSETHTVWQSKLRSGIGTPVVVDGKLYWTATGIAFCASCADGQEVYRERLNSGGAQSRGPAGDYASPVAAGDKILMVRRNGSAFWVTSSETFASSPTSAFSSDESLFNATPAIAGDAILVRSNQNLYCIGNSDAQ